LVGKTGKGAPKKAAPKKAAPKKAATKPGSAAGGGQGKKAGAKGFARRNLRQALVLQLKQQEQQRRGNKVSAAGKTVSQAAEEVPLHQRAGYPLVPTKVDPANWRTIEGKRVFVDMTRVPWLPDDFGQGVKMTNPISRSTPGQGGTYTVYVSSEGKVYYHRSQIEKDIGRPLTYKDGWNGQKRLQRLSGMKVDDKAFFGLLSPKERKCLPKADDLHFCVVSARRTDTKEGLADIAVTQANFENAGVVPTWYVDAGSVKAYRDLGLKVVVGGKLTEARNKCLRDAARMGKACVQVSDDISRYTYHDGAQAEDGSDEAANRAFAASICHVLTPVSAARFLLAKLRAAQGSMPGYCPQLAGVYPLGSCSRAFGGPAVTTRNFILGDFIVVDNSPLRFDEEMTLKEDYDFTAHHITRHGGVLRCNRMTVAAKHHAPGGAESMRDKKGLEEQRNIAILQRKWPGAFRAHPKRKNEVVLQWPRGGEAETGDATAPVAAKKRGCDAAAAAESGVGKRRGHTASKR